MPKPKTTQPVKCVNTRQAQFADSISRLMDLEFNDLTLMECVGVFETIKHGCLARLFTAAALVKAAKSKAMKKGRK